MNKKLVIIIPIVVIVVIVIFSFSSNAKSQNNNQSNIATNVPAGNNILTSTPTAPKKIEISLSESVNMAAK
jgi:preprotein translocase subunit YajC